MRDNLSQSRLKDVLVYNPNSGDFRWKVFKGPRAQKGEIAGTKTFYGYLKICVDGTEYLCHRLAWLYMTGEWPKNEVDHKDSDGMNNKWGNLRLADRNLNCQNLRTAKKNNLSGMLGVSRSRDKWKARISLNGKRKQIGVFDTPEEAHRAYLKTKREIHAGCTI